MEQSVDVIGVGLGPSNLSLAALADPIKEIKLRCFEVQPTFQWHPGIMVPAAQLQVSYLKDLVTLVDPTSRFSFLNYLVRQRRVYRFLTVNRDGCPRQEFERYYRWVAEQLSSIRWNIEVQEIRLKDDVFEVRCSDGSCAETSALVLGSGPRAVLPDFAEPFKGKQVLHSSEFLAVRPETAGKDVMVVGAGQSGAEVVNYLLSETASLPTSLTWVSSRVGFLPIDDSPFTNEWFAPPYIDYFYDLPPGRRAELLERQRLASDGVTESLLREIYRRLYQLDLEAEERMRHRLVACRRVVDLARNGGRLRVTLHDEDTDRWERCDADVVIFCTGYRNVFPEYLEPLRARLLNEEGVLQVRKDYSLAWDGPPELNIFVQNAAQATHGIADPNLSLISWRSARILNALCGWDVYELDRNDSMVTWDGPLSGDLIQRRPSS